MSKNSALVRYGNELNRARSRLDVVEQRIIRRAISQVPAAQDITCDQIFYITAEDLVDLGSNPAMVYRDMKAAVKTLYDRSVTLLEEDAQRRHVRHQFRYVQSVWYHDDEGKVGLRFSYDILPFINQLKTEFTQQGLLDTKGLRSAYAVRIYGILSQFKSTGTCSIKVDDLRQRLDLGDRFKAYGHLKDRVLNLAIKQINEGERTAFTVSMREKKKGRRVDTLIFTLKPKEQALPSEDARTYDLLSGLSESQCTLTERQAAMYADFLSKESTTAQQLRADRLGKDTHAIFEAFRKMHFTPDGSTPGAFTKWLKKKLLDPAFVSAIYKDFLRPLGFQPGKP